MKKVEINFENADYLIDKLQDILADYLHGGESDEVIAKFEELLYVTDAKPKMPNLKPFSLVDAKAGKPVCTRDGRRARIICFDYCGTSEYFPIIALVKYHDSNNMPCECIIRYTKDGKCDKHGSPHKHDLMMLPEKKEGYMLLRKGSLLFPNKEEAEKECTNDYYVAKVSWEE